MYDRFNVQYYRIIISMRHHRVVKKMNNSLDQSSDNVNRIIIIEFELYLIRPMVISNALFSWR